MLLSILIPTKNNIHFTERCLISLLNDLQSEGFSPSDYEILLLDENSVDGIDQLIEHYRGINIRKIEFPDRSSFSHKNNVGVQKSEGEYVLLLNNDVEILEHLVRPMIAGFTKNPNVGMVGNKHYFPNMQLNHVGMAYDSNKQPVHLYPNETDDLDIFNRERVVPALTAACVMVRKDQFLKIGGFDEKYHYGYEDVDLCLKYKYELGKDCLFTPDSKIIHFGQSTYGRTDHEDFNRNYFFEKWKDAEFVNFEEIYKQDRYASLKKRKDIKKKIRNKVSSLMKKSGREDFDYKYDDKTLVLFYSDLHTSFNDVLRRLHSKLEAALPDGYNVIKDDPINFPKYYDSDAVTVTWTHFWTEDNAGLNYFSRTRKQKNKDLRFYAVNYENTSNQIDYWTNHILKSQFMVLPISQYCADFLINAGIEKERLQVMSLGYTGEIDQQIEKFSDKGRNESDPIRYLIIANSSDMARFNTELALKAFAEAFDKEDNVKLVIKDYGGDKGKVRNLISRYLDGYDVEFIERFLSEDEMAEMYVRSDVLIAPFRGEGFGIKMIDAIAAGALTVAPNYGGPKDFLNIGVNLDVEYELEQVDKGLDYNHLFLNESYVDCAVKYDSLVKQLSRSHKEFKKLSADALQKSSEVRKQFSWSVLGEKLAKFVTSIDKSKPISREMFEAEPLLEIKNLDEQPHFSILVNSYNRPENVVGLLESILKLPDIEKHSTEVVIVDDGSPQDYLKQLESYKKIKSINIRYYRYPDNRGMTYSKNMALYHARGKIGVFIGDDIRPLPGFLSRRAFQHENNPKLMVLGHTEWMPEIRNNLIAEFSVKFSGFQFDYETFRNRTEMRAEDLYTSNISFDVEAIKQVDGYFEDILGIKLYEDALWGQKLSEYGFSLVYDRKIEALHDHAVGYTWFISRSQLVGFTKVFLYSVIPESKKFTHIERILREVRPLYSRFSDSKLGNGEDLISYLEKSMEDEFNLLSQSIEKTEDYYLRNELRARLHMHLFRVNGYYTLKGVLEALNITDSLKVALVSEYYKNSVNLNYKETMLSLAEIIGISDFMKYGYTFTRALLPVIKRPTKQKFKSQFREGLRRVVNRYF